MSNKETTQDAIKQLENIEAKIYEACYPVFFEENLLSPEEFLRQRGYILVEPPKEEKPQPDIIRKPTFG